MNPEEFISIAIDGVCYLTTALLYFKLYSAVRHHINHIHVLQEQLAQNNGEDMANAATERKAAVGTFYIRVCCVSDLLSAIHLLLDYPQKHWTKYNVKPLSALCFHLFVC